MSGMVSRLLSDKLKVFFVFLVVSLFLLDFASSACVSVVTLHNSRGELVKGRVYAFCEKVNKSRELVFENGKGVVQSFGGPFDSCENYCGNLYVRVSNDLFRETGVFYPMNSSNQKGWNESSSVFYLDFVLDGKKTSSDISLSYSSGSKVPSPKGVLDKGVYRRDEENVRRERLNERIERERKLFGKRSQNSFSYYWFALFFAFLLTIFLWKFRKKVKIYKPLMFINKKEVEDGANSKKD